MRRIFVLLIMLTVSLVSMGQKECVVNLEKSGKLGSVVNKKDIPYITKLTIKGGSNIELIEKDWKIIQKMTSLETLDLTGINKEISYIPMNDKIGGKFIPNVKHLIVFEGEITPAHHEGNENQYKRDMKEFWDISGDCDGLQWRLGYLGDIDYFPDLETLEIKNNAKPKFSFEVPEIMYASNYNHKWRGGIKKDGTLFIERKDVAKNFKGYHIVSEHSFLDKYLEGGFSQALYIDGSCEKYATNISSLTIPSCLRYIDHGTFNDKFNRGININIEDGDDLLYIDGKSFNIITNKVLAFNRPVYLEGQFAEECHPDTIIFNKDVEYLYSLSANNFVFKKIPKKIYKYKDGRNGISCHKGTIEIPAGSDKFFVDNGFSINQLYYAKGEVEKQRIQDSLDVAESKKLMPYKWLLNDCIEYTEFDKDRHTPDFSLPFWKKFAAMCENDQISYFNKNNLDELDKALYKKSDTFQKDKAEFEEKCKGTYGLFVSFDEKVIKFTAEGFSFYVGGYGQLTRDDPTSINYLKFPHFQFPIKKGVCVNKQNDYARYIFACNDVDKLKQIRECGKSLSLLLLFQPLTFAKVGIDYYIANPVGLYLVNHTSGEILLDLSASVRKTSLQQEKPIITSWQNFEKAKEERNKPKYHKQAKQVRCMFCGGKGYTEASQPERINGVWTTPTHRCTFCYGKGYTMEHYY